MAGVLAVLFFLLGIALSRYVLVQQDTSVLTIVDATPEQADATSEQPEATSEQPVVANIVEQRPAADVVQRFGSPLEIEIIGTQQSLWEIQVDEPRFVDPSLGHAHVDVSLHLVSTTANDGRGVFLTVDRPWTFENDFTHWKPHPSWPCTEENPIRPISMSSSLEQGTIRTGSLCWASPVGGYTDVVEARLFVDRTIIRFRSDGPINGEPIRVALPDS